MLLTIVCSLSIVLGTSLPSGSSSLSWLQPPSRSACKIIAFEAKTSQAKNGNLKPPIKQLESCLIRWKDVNLLVCLVVIVLVFRMMDRVSNQLL